MRNALPVLALAALIAAPALAAATDPSQTGGANLPAVQYPPGPPTSPGADVQTKPGPPIAPGAAAGENKLLPAVRPPNPNRGLGVPPPDPDKDASAAAGENKKSRLCFKLPWTLKLILLKLPTMANMICFW